MCVKCERHPMSMKHEAVVLGVYDFFDCHILSSGRRFSLHPNSVQIDEFGPKSMKSDPKSAQVDEFGPKSIKLTNLAPNRRNSTPVDAKLPKI